MADLSDWPTERLEELAEKLSYSGNPLHKKNPKDYGLTPPCAGGRPGKTLCEVVNISGKNDALELLREGCRRGLIDHNMQDEWPKRIWALHEGKVLEAQHDSTPPGSYHGYPLQEEDAFREYVVDRWENPS